MTTSRSIQVPAADAPAYVAVGWTPRHTMPPMQRSNGEMQLLVWEGEGEPPEPVGVVLEVFGDERSTRVRAREAR